MTRRIKIRRGLDVPVAGRPEQSIYPGKEVGRVGLNGLDYLGLKPRLQVAEGEGVRRGDTLFFDRRDPAVRFTSPGSGRVLAVNRGARRVLESVVIDLDEERGPRTEFAVRSLPGVRAMDPGELAEDLQTSGLWTAFRTRPFSRVPHSQNRPRSIFVTAIDTQPLAADPAVVSKGREDAMAIGLAALTRLTDGPTWFCTGPSWNLALPDLEGLEQAVFKGPHPAGLPGTHIHFLDPVGTNRTVWHIGYQDVIAIGEFLLTGQVPVRRVVALGGHLVKQPRLVNTRLGASLDDLLSGELLDDPRRRTISGSVLHGRNAGGHHDYLGRFHDQVSVITEGGRRRFLGWSRVGNRAFSAAGTWLKASGHREREFTTARHGRFSGMLPMRVFERLMPLDILPSPLFRALLVMDTEQARALGALELAEEDLALCTFACPAKTDYGGALRLNLDHIEKYG